MKMTNRKRKKLASYVCLSSLNLQLSFPLITLQFHLFSSIRVHFLIGERDGVVRGGTVGRGQLPGALHEVQVPGQMRAQACATDES